MKKYVPKGILAAALIGVSAFLLRGDVWVFWTWWMLAAVMGAAAMPVTGRLFKSFDDKGWMFSKVLAIAASGFFTWFLVSIRLIPFHTVSCVGVAIVCAVLCFILFHVQTEKGIECFPTDHISLIYWEELLFFVIFLMWTYFAAFRPQAYGTEKFMDYGFMESMMRSTTFPPADIWYSEGKLNYYYGGQYFAVFLTRLSGSTAEMTYNLMRMLVAALAFVLPFSLVYQMMRDRLAAKKGMKTAGIRAVIPALSGLLAGTAVSIAGNMHYVIYCKLIPWITQLRGEEYTDSYWFPNATRYIGFNPDVPDKTIHEFPCYSFVLGDLHAHVVNIMFVLLVMGLLYAWMKNVRTREAVIEKLSWKELIRRNLLMPHILIVSALLGMFQWTNFWDYVIYFVVTGGVVLFVNIVQFEGKAKKIFLVTALQAAEVLLVSYMVILPFTLQFQTMVQGVALAQYHSLPHQLLVLWGLPCILTVAFIIAALWEKLKVKSNRSLYRLMRSMSYPDLFAVIMGLCAIGLVMIPELVYVRDIYENGNARANTMFKLTYQAYILFGMTMGYVIFRMLVVSRQLVLKVLSSVGLLFLLFTVGYFGNSVRSWYGEVWDMSQYQGLNATAFLDTEFPEDVSAIRWLKENVKGMPVVLEANGDSYSEYERVSAMTGLPTILGWYVHEWLWRNDTSDLNVKSADIETIYTSENADQVHQLLEEYDVSYIFVGSTERKKYEDRLNEDVIKTMGPVVYRSENSDTYIIQVS